MILDELEIALLSPEAATAYVTQCRKAYYAAEDADLFDKLATLDLARKYCPHIETDGEGEYKYCLACWAGFGQNSYGQRGLRGRTRTSAADS